MAGFFLLMFLLPSCHDENVINPIAPEEEFETRAVTLTPIEQLGKNIFNDNISFPNKQSCATCHAPGFGFTGNHPGANLKEGIYRGALSSRWGFRKPPSAAYATFSPTLYFDATRSSFIGGNNWDGSATGEHLGTPARDQALLPFRNPLEMNNPSIEFVLSDIESSNYASLWTTVWGAPIDYHNAAEADQLFHKVALSIAAYEASPEVNSFTSKFDYYLQGLTELNPEEAWGLVLFNTTGKCNLCHPSDGDQPLFTNFSYHNIGAPRNPNNPYYNMDTEYIGGEPINPEGDAWIDPGLGGMLQNHPNPAWQAMAAQNWGKFKVPTLRNVGKKNGGGNTKAYHHNGIFKTLDEIVHFYNTRDTGSWPPPEVAENINTTAMGNLGLTLQEEKAIVAFMKTLSDGYILK